MIYSLLIETSHEDLIVHELPLPKNVNLDIILRAESMSPESNLNRLVRLR